MAKVIVKSILDDQCLTEIDLKDHDVKMNIGFEPVALQVRHSGNRVADVWAVNDGGGRVYLRQEVLSGGVLDFVASIDGLTVQNFLERELLEILDDSDEDDPQEEKT